jgi:hypothetical protein
VWNLDRDHVLTLASLPALLGTRAVSPPIPAAVVEPVDDSHGLKATRAGRPVEVPASGEYRRAVAEHDDALTAYFLYSPSRHRARAVGDMGRRLLDLVQAQTSQPVAALTLAGAPTTAHPVPPEHWPRSQRVSAVRLQPGQLMLGYLDATTVHAFGEPERIEYVLGHAAVTVHTHTGRRLVLDPYTPTYRVFTETSPADADLINCARSIMITHLDRAVVAYCASLGEHDVIDHATAKKIAHAYQWGWATCWFAGEGEIGHPDGARLQPGEDAVITAMGRYLTGRAAAGELGPVFGWEHLPIR